MIDHKSAKLGGKSSSVSSCVDEAQKWYLVVTHLHVYCIFAT